MNENIINEIVEIEELSPRQVPSIMWEMVLPLE